ncbi:hypothetical protein SUGI_0528270 [Cryptomeria japonica]|nr:hypothetical protein SUGI_0528270 [Cryptomeria japonica]
MPQTIRSVRSHCQHNNDHHYYDDRPATCQCDACFLRFFVLSRFPSLCFLFIRTLNKSKGPDSWSTALLSFSYIIGPFKWPHLFPAATGATNPWRKSTVPKFSLLHLLEGR